MNKSRYRLIIKCIRLLAIFGLFALAGCTPLKLSPVTKTTTITAENAVYVLKINNLKGRQPSKIYIRYQDFSGDGFAYGMQSAFNYDSVIINDGYAVFSAPLLPTDKAFFISSYYYGQEGDEDFTGHYSVPVNKCSKSLLGFPSSTPGVILLGAMDYIYDSEQGIKLRIDEDPTLAKQWLTKNYPNLLKQALKIKPIKLYPYDQTCVNSVTIYM